MRLTLPCVLLLCLAAPAAAQDGPWVDPRLRGLTLRPALDLDARESPLEPAPGRRPGLVPRRPLVVRTGPGGQPWIDLLVEVRETRALAEIRAAGGRVGRVVGRVATVRAPVSAVPTLTRLTSLARVEAARPYELHNDSAVSRSRVDEVRRVEAPYFLGTTGRDVLVGVIDTGLDYDHEDFRDIDGAPRTIALWDQVTDEICLFEDLRTGACASQDRNGHGTHVAGTAAGDGSAPGVDSAAAFRYAGVAPEASIAAVRFSFLSDADLVDGVGWMFDQAGARGLPAVVNMSLGSQFGPHDGTTLLELALDSLSGPGRIIVTSAGNDGNAPNTSPGLTDLLVHASAMPGTGTEERMSFRITGYDDNGGCSDFVLLDLWYDGAQEVTFEVQRPDGSTVTATTGQDVVEDDPLGQVWISAPSAPYPGNGDRNAIIELNGCGSAGAPAAGTWDVRVTSPTPPMEPLHMWIAAYSVGGGLVLGEAGFTNSHAVGIPATAREVIAVAAYTSRLCWPSPGDPSVCTTDVFGFGQPLGDIAFFSSPGPTRDGRLKPDIAAPGMMIMSTRSDDISVPTPLLGPTRRHRVELGTSMAAPHVAGAIALLLQHAPDLTPDSVRSILSSTAAADAFTSRDYSEPTGTTDPLPNEQWGHGKLDARAALETLVDPAAPIALWLSATSDTLPLGATLDVRGIVINAFGDSLAAPAAWSSSDPAVATVDSDGLITPVAVGTTVVTASASGFSEDVFVEVVPPAVLIVDASALDGGTTSSRPGTRIPLIDLALIVDGFEGVLVDSLGFALSGRDPGARFLLIEDEDDDGAIDPGEPVVADADVALTEDSTVVALTPDLVIAAQDTLDLIAALQLSGAVPNGARFQALFLPELTSSIGLRSGADDLRRDPAAVVASAITTTTLLESGEVFNLSENPVRSDAGRLVLNFGQEPTLAAVFTLRGVRVADLLRRLDPGGVRIEWDLRTDEGGAVAPGIYFLVVRVGDELIRQKLIIARGFGSDDE